MLVSPTLLRRSIPWLALAFVLGYRVVTLYPLLENHGFLAAYWCLAIGLQLTREEGVAEMVVAPRLLIGLTFLFAWVWKAMLSPDFVSGDFLRFTFLTDLRFQPFVTSLGGLSEADWSLNQARMSLLLTGATTQVDLVDTRTIGSLALAATWWTIVVEALVAVAFLVPHRRLTTLRNVSLLAFLSTVYVVVPVPGFGCLLAVMGYSQAESRSWRIAYLVAAVLVFAAADLSFF